VVPTVTLPKFSLVGDNFTIVPDPLSVAVGEPATSVVMVNVAGPSAVLLEGLNAIK